MKAINNEIIDINCYTLPFEGEKHFATVIMLPFREDVWYKKALPARENFKEVIFQIAEYETVILAIDPSIDEKIVHEFERENIIIYRIKYDDSWARDTSPIFLINRDEDKIVGVDFGFNAYGGKDHGLYYPYDNDDNFAKNLLLELCIPSFKRKDFVLEGGSICCDGKGSLLTTRECLLSPDRNPSMSEEEMRAAYEAAEEKKWRDYAETRRILDEMKAKHESSYQSKEQKAAESALYSMTANQKSTDAYATEEFLRRVNAIQNEGYQTTKNNEGRHL